MKKKLTLLFTLLALCVSGWATTSITVNTGSPLTSVSQISTDKYYVLKNVGRNQYLNINSATGQVLLTGSLPTSSDAALLPYIVRFVVNTDAKSEGDAYQLKFYDGTYLPSGAGSGKDVIVSTTMGTEGYNDEGFLPTYVTDHFTFRAYWGNEAKNLWFNGNSGSFCFYTNSTDNTSKYQIYEATCENFQEISYNYQIKTSNTSNESRKLLTVKSTTVAIPTDKAMSSKPLFTSVASAPTASGDGSAITFTLAEDYPFATTALVDGNIPASAPLYRFHLRDASTYNDRYAHYNSTSHEVDYTTADATLSTADYFCFAGNQIDGFQVYNVAAGGTCVMGNNTPSQGAKIAMTESGEAKWELRKNSEQGFTMIQTTGGVANAYLHDYSTTFSYWMSSSALTDAGSGLVIERITFDVTDEHYVRLGEGEYSLMSSSTTTYNSGDAYVNVSLASSALTLDNTVGAPSYVSSATTVKYYYTAKDAVINVTPSKGIYYNSSGVALERGASDVWGPTWKSDEKAADGTPLLTVTTSTGMENSTGDIYTGAEGATMRYTLTAADGYVITGYTINGTASGADVKITPRLRSVATVTNGSSLGSALAVSDLDLNITSFTLSASAAAHLSSLALNVTLAYSSTKTYTNPVENGTLAYIGFKHTDTGTGRLMKFLSNTGGAVSSANRVTTTLDAVPETAGVFQLVYDATERAYYLKEPHSGNYLYAKDITMNSNLSSGDQGVLGVGSLPVSGDKSTFQWKLDAGGVYASTNSYYIRPKLNTNTAIAVWSDARNYFVFHNAAPDYGFAHAFFPAATWKTVTDTYMSNNSVKSNVDKAGKVGYPEFSNEYAAGLRGLFTLFDGDTYNETAFNNLKSWYTSYVNSTDVVLPEVGKFYTLYQPTNNRYIQSVTPNSIMQMNANGTSANAIFYVPYTGRFLSFANGHAMNARKIDNGYYDASGYGSYTIDHYTGHALGTLRIKSGNMYLLDYSSSTDIYDSSNGADATRSWIVTEVTSLPITMHEVSGAYYATINLPVAVTLPEGLYAYSAMASGDVLTLTKVVENGVLAANQPVLLYSASNVTSLDIASTAGTSAASNEFEGTIAAKSVTVNDNYVLSTGDNGVGFYKYNNTEMPPFRAYLPSSATSNVKAFTFSFEDAEDAIRAIESENSGLEIYDISGRRVQKAQKGLYIVNGKKVMYK